MNPFFCCGNLIGWLVFGLIAGAIARLLIPGKQPIGIVMTIVLGIVGSWVGGGLYWVINRFLMNGADAYQVGGWIMSIIGATIVLAIWVNIQRKKVSP